ncbi:hypothetical protein GCM10009608_70940 [Pseudonocardia alaniniphila]
MQQYLGPSGRIPARQGPIRPHPTPPYPVGRTNDRAYARPPARASTWSSAFAGRPSFEAKAGVPRGALEGALTVLTNTLEDPDGLPALLSDAIATVSRQLTSNPRSPFVDSVAAPKWGSGWSWQSSAKAPPPLDSVMVGPSD